MGNREPFELRDFSGGFTDEIVGVPEKFSEILDNFIILEDRTINTRPGCLTWGVLEEGDTQIPAGEQRIGELINYQNNDTLLTQSANKIYYRDSNFDYQTLVGPSGNNVFSTGTVDSFISHSELNGQLVVVNSDFVRPQKIYRDSSDVLQLRTAGLPVLATAPVPTPTAGAGSYLYTFIRSYTYTVGQRTYIDKSAILEVLVSSAAAPNVSAINWASIPVLSNGATYNYDTANVKVEIYRTINGGIDSYKAGEVTNGTTTFADTMSDTTLQDQEPIYTAGGVLPTDEPPLCKFVHQVNNVCIYAHIKEGSEVFKNLFRFSVPNDIDGVPVDNEGETEDEITGFSSAQSIPIALCKRYIYRVEGGYDNTGRGFANPIRISDHAGCISHQSIVQAEGNIFWFGNDGVYYSDAYKTMKVSDHWNRTYKTFISNTSDQRRIQGKFDETNRRIYWTIQVDEDGEDNDAILVLDLRYGISETMSFYTWSGNQDDATDVNFVPTALEVYNDQLHRAHLLGFVFVHDEEVFTDPKIDLNLPPEDWITQTILYTYRSVAFNFGTAWVRKWCTKVLSTLKNKGNIAVAIRAINDVGTINRDLKPIRHVKNLIWGDDSFIWGDTRCAWYYGGLIEQWRRFPARGLRLNYLQLEYKNAKEVITTYESVGEATADFTTNIVTLGSGDAWPEQCEGYYISFEDDNYVTEYKILDRTNDLEILVQDQSDTLPDGQQKWLIRGKRKGQVLNLRAFIITYMLLSDTQITYESGDDGEL